MGNFGFRLVEPWPLSPRRSCASAPAGIGASAPTVGQAVEDCITAAETNASKRAFVTFGNIFGLALYGREQRNVGVPERRPVAAPSEAPLAPIDEGFDQLEPQRPTTSQRAVAAARPANVNGRDRGPLPY